MNNARKFTLALVFLVVFAGYSVELAVANPIMTSMIDVTSPQNGQVYTSNDIELTFTALTGYNLSASTYSLDGQSAKPTNGSTHLTDIPSGLHEITIYGTYTYTHKGTNYTYFNENRILQTVHFSVNYNTNQITFAATVSALLVATCSVAFVGRKRLVGRLKGEKTGVFWLGLVCLVFFGTVLVGPFAWQMLSNYLFPAPYYPRGMVLSSFPLLLLGVFFMGIGVAMMVWDTRQRQSGNKTINR